MGSGITLLPLVLAALPPEGSGGRTRELAPGISVLGSSDRFGSANLGWVALPDQVVLIGAPARELAARAIDEAQARSGKPVRIAVLTQLRPGEREAAAFLSERGIRLVATKETARRLSAPRVEEFTGRLEIGQGAQRLEVLDLGHAAGPGDAAVYAPGAQVLFAGEVCANGPRAQLTGSSTEGWLRSLEALEKLPLKTVVPGFGSIGGRELLARQRSYLRELRRQVAHLVSQGRPLADLTREVRIDPERQVWMPYDDPQPEDLAHLHAELTVPQAPFGGRPPPAGGSRPRALALIADRVHEPGHIEEALAPALDRAGVEASFAFDVRALGAANLKAVGLLVVLRDGMVWPRGPQEPYQVWMTREQEQAVVDFVEPGGGFLVLHNAMGIYPEGGPYLKLIGGTYQGHGPLERFRVRVLDAGHPITRGVSEYEVADEQHTPRPEPGAVHLILESRSDEGVAAAAGWVREVGKGRVAYLANGHTRESLAHPMVQKLIENAARWCLRR
ncbi:MAG: ThuA domain-containing protein [Thermoanaerobaculia bacterium]